MSFSAAQLLAVLQAHVPTGANGFVVALSGGADSSALLAALAQLRAPPVHGGSLAGVPLAGVPLAGVPLAGASLAGASQGLPIRAVHVDHGLQAASVSFREACASLCRDLGVPLTIVAVPIEARAGVSVEAAARDARYAALAAQLRAGECLLTAHHLEDQAETLLLQALRGAGLKGLASMPLCRPFASGWHLRPLLSARRTDLRQFAAALGIAGMLDPMNADPRYDRVYLRRELWPLIENRWPGAGLALSRTASHVAEAQHLLDAIADADLALLRDGDALSVPRLRSLATARQVNALRRWIFEARALPPPAARLLEALRQILDADADHLPAIAWDAQALRRYRDRIFLTAATPPRLALRHPWEILTQPRLDLDAGLGQLHCVERIGGLDRRRLPAALLVCGREGGEALKLGLSASTRSVQHLCQALGVLPWMRDSLPFVYAGDELIGIGDLWLDARWCVAGGERGLAFEWAGAPNLV
ncbi:MAG: tRNA lysidine(34) synthetase TilS [Steroidobacteraceae bacterium]|jgi:tRNA(Ile)-lysidine synthase